LEDFHKLPVFSTVESEQPVSPGAASELFQSPRISGWATLVEDWEHDTPLQECGFHLLDRLRTDDGNPDTIVESWRQLTLFDS
jgi:hypothetical protein